MRKMNRNERKRIGTLLEILHHLAGLMYKRHLEDFRGSVATTVYSFLNGQIKVFNVKALPG